MTSLKATTLQSIPSLRAIANDVILDVLMYMTATFCQSVLECVTEQISEVYQKFKKVHPHYSGKASLMGHSLGSVIVWDLLSILKQHNEQQKDATVKKQQPTPSSASGMPDIGNVLCGIDIANKPNSSNINNDTHLHGYQAYATTDEHANKAENGYWGPSLPKPMTQSIPFQPDFTIFLGSPLGLFLTLRGAHAVFDEMRIQQQTDIAKEEESLKQEKSVTQRQTSSDSYEIVDKDQIQKEADGDKDEDSNTLVSPFTLPSGAIYNIFHPSDPVAYRVEPLLLPQDTSLVEVPPPVYLTKQGQSVRFHVKAMQLTRSIAEKSNTWSSLLNQVTEQAVTALSTSNAEDESTTTKKKKVPAITKFPLGGKSDRVDFQLQPGVIDNEYLSAVTAHSNYFVNTDLLEFVLDLVSVQSQPQEQDKDKKNQDCGNREGGNNRHRGTKGRAIKG